MLCPSPAQHMSLLLPPRSASTKCNTEPPSMLYSLAVLSSFICLPPKMRLRRKRNPGEGGKGESSRTGLVVLIFSAHRQVQ